VLDNSSTRKTPSIQRWLVRHARFMLHLTSNYSSWLNVVERWFTGLTTKWLKRSAHRSVRNLVASIRHPDHQLERGHQALCPAQGPR
jgi:transposase